MNKFIFKISIIHCLSLLAISFGTQAQNPGNISMKSAKFITGDNPSYKADSFDDSQWETQRLGSVWQEQGHADYHGYAWYRIHVVIPSSLKEKSYWKDSLRIYLAHVNDVDETFLNGKKIGHIGAFPDEQGGYISKWPAEREYHLSVNDNVIKWDKENIIAIRVYDGGGTGGIFMGEPYIDILEKINGFHIDHKEIKYLGSEKALVNLNINNEYGTSINGVLLFTVTDIAGNKQILTKQSNVILKSFEKKHYSIPVPDKEGIVLNIAFTENTSGLTKSTSETIPYILTPAESPSPKINGARAFGVQPGHPFLFKIPATGLVPITYSAANLPQGLELDQKTGIIKGIISKEGEYKVNLFVKNKKGSDHNDLLIKVGNTLALTPPMGWNSWNCWGISVSDTKVRQSAQALIDKGLINHGWSYINIDDGWESPKRADNGNILTNEKFPDMKGLGDFLHDNGLKFGIYSSPGPLTCGGYTGSYKHELSDAQSYANWGIDYLKYDLCSYLDMMTDKGSLEKHIAPYEIMRDALSKQNRDIIYSLCQYGMEDVWKWGRKVNGNLWRTTGDITDTWESLYNIGFSQNALYSYAGPGGWNDPDMLVIGMVGWGENLHPTDLTPDEQYTHVSMWSLLSAPLLIGCDISRLDPFTLNLITNDEVIAIDQDVSGKEAQRLLNKDSIQVYVKELSDGSHAVGVFNIADSYKKVVLSFEEIGLTGNYKIRDVWRQKNIHDMSKRIEIKVPPHGVFLAKLTKDK